MRIFLVKADNSLLVKQLTRVADALERLAPLPSAKQKLKPIGIEQYTRVTDDRIMEAREREREEVLQHGVNRGTSR